MSKIDLIQYQTLVFDCDGVLLNSNKIKTQAFYDVAKVYGHKPAQKLKDYHLKNGGISRYKKFEYLLISILRKSPEKYIFNLGIKQINNKACQVFKVVNPDFSFSEYIVQKGEDIESIAKKFNLSSYLILVENNLNFYNDIALGDKILIPNSYGEQFEIWIDLQSSLPIVQKVFVNNKLFEYYEFEKIVVNPEFSYDEFDKNYVEYNF